MEYKFTDKATNEISIVPPERWVWGVVYKPTESQLEVSRVETEERDRVIRAECGNRVLEMVRAKRSQKDIDIVRQEYDLRMKHPAGLVRDELHQFGDDGIFHQVGEIDQDRVQLVTLYRYDDMTKRVDIPFREGMKLIHKYRNVRPAGYKDFIRVYMFGYKYEGSHAFYFILPDDRVILSPTDDIDLTLFDLTPAV